MAQAPLLFGPSSSAGLTLCGMTPSSITTKMRRKTSGTKSAIKNRNHLTRPENRKAPEGYHSVTSMDMSKMQSRLREACQTNDRGWLRELEEECSWGKYLASGEHRDVYESVYSKGARKGEQAVIKIFKKGNVLQVPRKSCVG